MLTENLGPKGEASSTIPCSSKMSWCSFQGCWERGEGGGGKRREEGKNEDNEGEGGIAVHAAKEIDDVILNNEITHLIFYNLSEFNQPIDNLPDSITHLTLGQGFNQKINKLLKDTFGVAEEGINKIILLTIHRTKDQRLLEDHLQRSAEKYPGRFKYLD